MKASLKKMVVISAIGLMSTSLGVALSSNETFKSVFASECEHVGNHYTKRDSTSEANGCKEYWVCCKCHNYFVTDTLIDVTNGTWTDAGQATVTFSDNESEDIRFLSRNLASKLSDMGFGTVIDNGDGTFTVGNFDEASHKGEGITIPEGVTSIQAGTFKGNGLPYIVIPSSIPDSNIKKIMSTGASKTALFFVGDTSLTAKELRVKAIYKIQEVGWTYVNGVPTAK